MITAENFTLEHIEYRKRPHMPFLDCRYAISLLIVLYVG